MTKILEELTHLLYHKTTMKIVLIRHAKSGDSIPVIPVSGKGYGLYSSGDELCRMTADIMWDGEAYEVTDLLAEISPAEASDKKLSTERACAFLDKVEENGSDIIAISHESFMKIMFKQLKKRGYIIKRTNIFKVDYLEKAVATKRRDRCGHCTQDCMLSNPGCEIGRDIAAREI